MLSEFHGTVYFSSWICPEIVYIEISEDIETDEEKYTILEVEQFNKR